MSAASPSALDVPSLNEGLLDPETVARLFADVGEHTQLLDVITKGAPGHRASSTPLSLAEAEAALASGQVRGVQLRYRWEGAEWWDTLLRLPEGFKLVRIRHDWGTSP